MSRVDVRRAPAECVEEDGQQRKAILNQSGTQLFLGFVGTLAFFIGTAFSCFSESSLFFGSLPLFFSTAFGGFSESSLFFGSLPLFFSTLSLFFGAAFGSFGSLLTEAQPFRQQRQPVDYLKI